MGGIDHHPGEAGGVEHALLLVEVPAARLLRQQSALEPVGEPRDDVLQAAQLLIEIGAEPAELLLVAQFGRLDGFVEAGREDLVIAVRREFPIAPAGGGKGAVVDIFVGGALGLVHFHLVRAAFIGRAVLGLLAAHLHVAAGGVGIVALLGRLFAAPLLALGLVAAFLRLILIEVLRGRQIEVHEQLARQLGEGRLVIERERQRIELGPRLFLDPRGDQLEPGQRGPGRRLAGQPLAGEQSDRGRQRHFFRSARSNNRIARTRASAR